MFNGMEVKRWQIPVESERESWRRWWKQKIIHFGAGLLSASLFLHPIWSGKPLWVWPLFGAAIAMMYILYQGYECWRRNDTPGRDVLDFLVAFVIGGVGWLIVYQQPWRWAPC